MEPRSTARSLDLVRSFEVRIKAAICIHAGIEQQANVVAMRQDAVEESPAHLAELLFALRVPEKILAVLR